MNKKPGHPNKNSSNQTPSEQDTRDQDPEPQPEPGNKNTANEGGDAHSFGRLEHDIRELRLVVENNLDAIANELMRAEARDEWMTQQITESRRILRRQSQILDVIQTAIQRGVRGLH